MVKVSESTRFPVPESVTVMVTEGVVSPSFSRVVQVNRPVFASMLIPAAMEVASKLKVSVSTGISESLAVAVNVKVSSSLTVWFPIGSKIGASLTGFTSIIMVFGVGSLSIPPLAVPPSSCTSNVKLV